MSTYSKVGNGNNVNERIIEIKKDDNTEELVKAIRSINPHVVTQPQPNITVNVPETEQHTKVEGASIQVVVEPVINVQLWWIAIASLIPTIAWVLKGVLW